jgi:hypothetical protein
MPVSGFEGMSVDVRRATQSDIPQLVELMRDLALAPTPRAQGGPKGPT